MSPQEQAIDALVAAGWAHDGATRTETVRMPTRRAPVYGHGGQLGGERRTFGGRLRYRKGERRVTIGKITTNFYHLGPRGPEFFQQYRTDDLAGIRQEAAA